MIAPHAASTEGEYSPYYPYNRQAVPIPRPSLFVASLALAMASTASAGDLAGYYTGVGLATARGSSNASTNTAFTPTGYFTFNDSTAVNRVGNQTIDSSGNGVSGVLGHNWVWGENLLGVEADLGTFNLHGSAQGGASYTGPLSGASFTINSDISTSWLATARARLGRRSGNLLFYVTGGIAYTNITAAFNFSDNLGATESATISTNQQSWIYGLGAEAMMDGPWSLKLEYLRADFGKLSVASNNLVRFGVTAFPNQTFVHTIDLKVNIFRAGLNYRF